MKNLAACRLKVPVRVQIVEEELNQDYHCPDAGRYHTLEAGRVVRVFDPQPMALTVSGYLLTSSICSDQLNA